MKIMLAGSGGGHVRQLLDLQPVWEKYPRSFVTEDTALGRSLEKTEQVDFVSHYAVGQISLGRRTAFLRAGLTNLFQSLSIIRKRKPDVIITTGAGAMFWTALAGKLSGAKIVLIDSFARFDAPSKFARILRPFADQVIVQSAKLGERWPAAHVFDPLKILEGSVPPKEDLLFATVGATLAFPRLVETVLAAKASGSLPERVILQVGEGGVPPTLPPGVEVHESLPFDEIQRILSTARFVVTHGGTGSLITALRAGCRVIAMPRRFSLGEHYDDHQEEITQAFYARGLIELADAPGELLEKIELWRSRTPLMATTDPAELTRYLQNKLELWDANRA